MGNITTDSIMTNLELNSANSEINGEIIKATLIILSFTATANPGDESYKSLRIIEEIAGITNASPQDHKSVETITL